jgi:hypothetical protein
MNLLIKTSALAGMLVLSLTTGARAAIPNPLANLGVATTPSSILLSQAHVPSDDFFDLSEMIIENIKMMQMGMKAMKSTDPAMKKMGEQMMNTAQTNLQMLLPKYQQKVRMSAPR